MRLGDIGVLAESIEKCLPEIAKNNGGEDIRHRLKVYVSVSQNELNDINRELYQMTNHKISEYSQDVGLVDLELVGIDFVISSSSDEAPLV